MKITNNIGMLLLSIYLIIAGLSSLITLPIPMAVLAVLAIVSGVFILIGR